MLMLAVSGGMMDTKLSNAMVYIGSMLLLGLDRETQQGLSSDIMDRFDEIAAAGTVQVTTEEAKLLLKQDGVIQVKMVTQMIRTQQAAEAEVIEIKAEHPAQKAIVKMDNLVKKQELSDDDEFQF